MTDILSWLEQQTRPREASPEHNAVMSGHKDFAKALKEKLGLEVEAEFGAILADLAEVERAEAFSRGFRLSAQLFSSAMLAR